MEVITDVRAMRCRASDVREAGGRLGLVPTMGALHRAHLSLLQAARRHSDISVMSIFVNPTQFGPEEDFGKYPRTLESDCDIARRSGCDIIFAPSGEAMYPPPYHTFVTVEKVTEGLCGARRPGHFRGVATVVLKLFNIIRPHVAVFGQKDAQQAVVLKRMVTDLHLPVAMDIEPTVREPDGLALSSRNAYLDPAERGEAPCMYRGLEAARRMWKQGERSGEALRDAITRELRRCATIIPEYVEIVDTRSLAPLDPVSGPALMAVACRTGHTSTRLIDNIVVGGRL